MSRIMNTQEANCGYKTKNNFGVLNQIKEEN